MMFNLVIQATGKVVAKETVIPKVLRRHYLVLVKVGIGCMGAHVGKVIYLRIHHEAEAENGIRHRRPNQRLVH